MFKKLLVITTLAAGLISTQASAAFVSTDWKSAGDGFVTLDTTTGIEWLKLPHTDMKSINTVISQLDTIYAGWRLPSEDEVRTMLTQVWSGLNVDVNEVIERGGAYTPGANIFAVMFSNGVKNTTHHFGMYVADDGVVRMAGSYLNENGAYTSAMGMDFYLTQTMDSVQAKWYQTSTHGVFLVSDGGTTLSSINDPTININNPKAPINMADVSAPAGLAAAGLLMLVFGGRRKFA